jgi:hypothetical protein
MKLEHGEGNNMKLKKGVHPKSTQTSVYFLQKKLKPWRYLDLNREANPPPDFKKF